MTWARSSASSARTSATSPSVFQGNWKNNIFIRYCVLPRGGEPVLFETAGSDLECAKIDAPWLERQHPARDHVEVGGNG